MFIVRPINLLRHYFFTKKTSSTSSNPTIEVENTKFYNQIINKIKSIDLAIKFKQILENIKHAFIKNKDICAIGVKNLLTQELPNTEFTHEEISFFIKVCMQAHENELLEFLASLSQSFNNSEFGQINSTDQEPNELINKYLPILASTEELASSNFQEFEGIVADLEPQEKAIPEAQDIYSGCDALPSSLLDPVYEGCPVL